MQEEPRQSMVKKIKYFVLNSAEFKYFLSIRVSANPHVYVKQMPRAESKNFLSIRVLANSNAYL